MRRRASTAIVVVLGSLLLGACATPTPRDDSAFRQSRPASMLVLPPVNDSPDVHASDAVLATAVRPLAEAGYYVFPVGMVRDTFRQNGLSVANDIHALPVDRLREIFGADAAVYLRVTDYGTRWYVLGSQTRVDIEARIVDLRSGALLWEGEASASSHEGGSASRSGLAGMLIRGVVEQIAGTVSDAAFGYAEEANHRLLGAGRYEGILAGPRAPGRARRTALATAISTAGRRPGTGAAADRRTASAADPSSSSGTRRSPPCRTRAGTRPGRPGAARRRA